MYHRIVLETHTFCNRNCDFCSIGKMEKTLSFMSPETLEKILSEIKENIHLFKTPLKFSLFRYNEPLIYPGILESTSKRIKQEFPDSFIYIHSNGDVIRNGHLNSIINHLRYIDEIYINDYDNGSFDSVYSLVNSSFTDYDSLGFKTVENNRDYIEINSNNIKYKFFISSSEDMFLTTRGSTVDLDIEPRNYDCDMLGKILVIETNGDIMACCEVSNRIAKHKDMVLGNIFSGFPSYNIDIYDKEACKYCNNSSEVCGL